MQNRARHLIPLVDYVEEMADRLRQLVAPALRVGDVEAIHQARVATRRLRAVIKLLEPVLPRPQRHALARPLRRLRRRLGPLRDLDVMLVHLQSLKKHKRLAIAGAFLESRLRDRRTKTREHAAIKLPPGKVLSKLSTWWDLAPSIESSSQAIDSLLAASLNDQLDSFASSADAFIAPANQSNTTETANPHAMRITGKLLRYTLELAAVQGHRLPPEVRRAFKQMQSALGLWHDYVVLAETAMQVSLSENLAAIDIATQLALLELVRVALQRAKTHLEKFASLWEAHGAAIADSIHATFPLIHPVATAGSVSGDAGAIIESQTDRDLPGSEPSEAPEVPGSADPAAA